MADRFWIPVAGVGTGNWSDTAHWSASSGGVGGASVPTSVDNVIFDANSSPASYVVTLNTTARSCLSFTASAPAAGNLTLAGAQTLNIFANMTLYAGMIWTASGSLNFASTSTGRTVTTAGVSIASSVNLTGIGGGWTMQDAFTCTGGFTQTRGNWNQNGFTLTCGFYFNNNSNARTYTMTGASLVVIGTSNGILWNTSTLTNLTLNNTGSTVDMRTSYFTSNTIAFPLTVSAGAWPFVNLTMSNGAGYGNLTITTPPTVSGAMVFVGNNANNQRMFVRSSVRGTQRDFTCNGTISITNCDFEDIELTGSAAPGAGTSVGDCGGNAGITFTAPVNRFWVGNGGDIFDTNHWSTISGGGSGASFPLPQDSAFFDANSFSLAGQSITFVGSEEIRLGSIDFTGVTNSPIFDNDNVTNFYGSATFVGMTFGGFSDLNMCGRGNFTLAQGGISNGSSWNFDSITGNYQLTSQFGGGASTPFIFVISGGFDANDQNVTCSQFNSNNSNVRTVLLGNGIIDVGLSGTPWVFTTVTNLTFDAEGSTIRFTANNLSVTFQGGGLTYNIVELAMTNTGTFTVVGSNTFADFIHASASSRSISFTAGTTQTFDGFHVEGLPADLITIQSATAANHNLVFTGAGVVDCDYLSISRSQATPNVDTWYAGANSFDGGNNTGWIFSDAPVVGGQQGQVFFWQ